MKDFALAWAVTAGIFTIIVFGLGWALGKGHYVFGILIDDKRNRMSLAKFQLAVWTIVVFSAFSVLMWVKHSVNIYLSAEVWGLLGISVSSMAGAAIIKGTKMDTQPAPTPPPPGGVAVPMNLPHGVLAVAPRPSFSDLFKGDELENQDFVDLSKVQMFFLTFIAVIGYINAMYYYDVINGERTPPPGYDAYFPELSSALLTILAISHAGYLTVKAAPHTRTR